MTEIQLKDLTPKSQRSRFGPTIVAEANALSEDLKKGGIGAPRVVIERFARSKVAHKIYEDRLRKEMDIDPLTGLLSRRAILRKIKAAMESVEKNGGSLQLGFIDVRELKRINDKYSHGHGDKALLLIATGLKANVRDTDAVGRIGGDENLVLFVDADKNVPGYLRQRLSTALAKEDPPYNGIQVDFGVVDYNPQKDGKLTVEDLLGRADQAMYYAKGHKLNTPVWWEPSMGSIEVSK